MVHSILRNFSKLSLSPCLSNNLISKSGNIDIKKLIYLFKKQNYNNYTIISQYPFHQHVKSINKYNNIAFAYPTNNYSTNTTTFDKNSQTEINHSDNNKNKNNTTDIINISNNNLDDHEICDTETSNKQTNVEDENKKNKEYMVLMFTCKICEKKSAKKFSKQAYNNGVVIIRCPQCNNLHLISDQLGWFQDGKTNIEQIIQEKGEKVIKKFSYNNLLEIDDLLNAYK
ncbi:Hsp70-escort protein 1, putative DNL-type zinc finger protein, putative [Plasmodium vinckei brucechwatti]|uniref:Hsp70-escort protein 1, putative DNL-type zinc finger protein, putative n=1 Tax=Plasmodium vinckei brucechwatti TaxID=119398 RepID=A0A6V7S765_PLAVN|nr:Hsp70-escort protein 1, putative DNL-type zinc finger protein, putative [Plasmodium vinckei brucechwatti]